MRLWGGRVEANLSDHWRSIRGLPDRHGSAAEARRGWQAASWTVAPFPTTHVAAPGRDWLRREGEDRKCDNPFSASW